MPAIRVRLMSYLHYFYCRFFTVLRFYFANDLIEYEYFSNIFILSIYEDLTAITILCKGCTSK